MTLVAGAVLYYRVGEHDYGAGFVTAGLSVALWLITWLALNWGWGGYLAGQLVLFAALTWYNIRRNSGRSGRNTPSA